MNTTYLMNSNMDFMNYCWKKKDKHKILIECFKKLIKKYPYHVFAHNNFTECNNKLNEVN